MIDITKTYKTKDGRDVRIYATDCGGDYPIHGAVNTGNVWNTMTWNNELVFNAKDPDNALNLIEYNPLLELSIDTPVLVQSESTSTWFKAHFAGIAENGRIEVFANGRSAWTANHISCFKIWKLP